LKLANWRAGRADDDDVAALAKADEICRIVGVPGLAATLRVEDSAAEADVYIDGMRPKGSFRIDRGKIVSMFNPSFFELQKSPRPS